MSKEVTTSEVSLTALFISFVRIGGVLFGGGYAMLPLLERELVVRRRWLDTNEMTDIFALSQVVPGAIAANVALLSGQRLCGTSGAVTALMGVIVAPLLVMLLIANIYDLMMDNPVVAHFVRGLRPAVAGLLFGTAIRMVRQNWRQRMGLFVGIIALSLMLLWEVNPVWPILAAIIVGITWQWWSEKR